MEKHPIGELLETTMQKVREMVDANTIVGEPITTQEGITLIPISKLSFGFGGGGADYQTKQQTANNPFGGAIGAGVKIEPVSFIVIKGDSVRMLNVTPPPVTTLDRVIETVPGVIDKVTDFIEKKADE